jgi:hypothetical protein
VGPPPQLRPDDAADGTAQPGWFGVRPPSDTASIGRFLSAGVEVDLELSQASFFSDHANEPVEVVCVDGATRTKVRGYFGQGESVLTGWTSAKDVQVSGWTPKPCVWGPKLRAQPVTCSFVRGR